MTDPESRYEGLVPYDEFFISIMIACPGLKIKFREKLERLIKIHPELLRLVSFDELIFIEMNRILISDNKIPNVYEYLKCDELFFQL